MSESTRLASLAPFSSRKTYPWEVLSRKIGGYRSIYPTDIDLYRHGESVANLEGKITGAAEVPLTHRGQEQAFWSGFDFRTYYDTAWSSPLSRSISSLEIPLQKTGVRVGRFFCDPRIQERALGVLELEDKREIAEYRNGDFDFAPPGGESYLAVTKRCLSFVVDLLEFSKNSNRRTAHLVSTHMGPMRILVGFLTHECDRKRILGLTFENARVYRFKIRTLHWPAFLPKDIGDDLPSR